MTIKIGMLRCFAAVAQSGNLTDAAAKLGRTPSAISMTLKQFEEHLGQPLFEADRKSKLTALGAFALNQTKLELEHFDRAVNSIESFARSESGLIRIAAVPSFAAAILPQVVESFIQQFPAVWLDLRDSDSIVVVRELLRERVDLGIATGIGATPEIEREVLFSDAFGVVCRADHPLAKCKTAPDWDALTPWPFLANGLCDHIRDETFQRILSTSQVMVRNTTSLLALVRAGAGITVLPRLVVNSAEQELVFVKVSDPNARRQIEVLKRADSGLSPAAQNFDKTLRRITGEIFENEG